MTDINAAHDGAQTEERLRDYHADGHLYAYRDGDEHVVVSNGREPPTQWEKRVPAERTTVEKGEKLWTIPDNWEQKVRLSGARERSYAIYHVPESGFDIEVSVPTNDHLIDAWYYVKAVGQLRYEHAGELDHDAALDAAEDLVDKSIEHAKDGIEIDEQEQAAFDLLSELVDQDTWAEFEESFNEGIEEYAPEALERGLGDEAPKLSTSGTDIWNDHFDISIDIRRAVNGKDVDISAYNRVADILREAGAVPYYPEVTARVEPVGGEEADEHTEDED